MDRLSTLKVFRAEELGPAWSCRTVAKPGTQLTTQVSEVLPAVLPDSGHEAHTAFAGIRRSIRLRARGEFFWLE